MTRRQLKALIRKTDAVQVDQIWMQVSAFSFISDDEHVLLLKAMGTGIAARRFTWDQLLKAQVKNTSELVLRDGTRMVFFKLQPISLVNNASTESGVQHK